MGNQRLIQTQTAATDQKQHVDKHTKQSEHPMQEVLGSRAASRHFRAQLQRHQAEGASSPNLLHSILQSISPVSPRVIQAKPMFRGLSHELTSGIGSNGMVIQAKMTIGVPADKYEQEADRVAQQVVQQLNAPSSQESILGEPIQRQKREENGKALMMKPLAQGQPVGGMAATQYLESSINRARGGGQPLEAGLQQTMGQAMGVDFSGVRVHTDHQADQLNRSIQAKAFTTGKDVFFGQGAYRPGSPSGQELIAHELTHVAQQNPQQIIEKNEGRIFSKSTSDIPRNNIETTTNKCIQTKFEAAENFQGHSNNQFGINEEIKLSVNKVKAEQYSGRLEWVLVKGGGKLSPTNPDGSATFIAGDDPGNINLDCYVKYIGQQVDSAKFTTVKPNGGYVSRKNGTNLKKLQDCWGVGFVGELFVTPNNVSFSNIQFREGTVAPEISGDWNAGLSQQDIPIADHSLGDWLPILEPNNGVAVNQVDTEDWIETGTKSAQPTGQPSGYIWRIPWEYRGMNGSEGEFTKVIHEVRDDGQGTATLSKGGATVTSQRSSPGSWLFPVSEDIARLNGGFPGQMTDPIKTFLANHSDIAANIHYMMRNGQTNGKNLHQLVLDECQYYKLAPP
jgi:Domain of unknown function (DUF4157)